MTAVAEPSRAQNSIPFAACGFALALGIATGVLCYLASGVSLGIFIGGIAFVALLGPYLSPPGASAMMLGIALTWFFVPITLWQYIRCVLVLGAFALMVIGLRRLLTRFTRSAVVGAGVTVVIAGIWLTWPISLARALPGRERLVSWLVFAHPIFAINGAVPELGAWTHQPVMYHLTNLGQDVTYELPRSIAACVALHALLGLTLLLAWWPARGPSEAVPS